MRKIMIIAALVLLASCSKDEVKAVTSPTLQSFSYTVVSGDFLPIGEDFYFNGAGNMFLGAVKHDYTYNGAGRIVSDLSECGTGFMYNFKGNGDVILTNCDGTTATLKIK